MAKPPALKSLQKYTWTSKCIYLFFFLQQAKIWGIFSNLYCSQINPINRFITQRYRMFSFLASARLMSLGCLRLNESPVAQAISSGELAICTKSSYDIVFMKMKVKQNNSDLVFQTCTIFLK